MRSIVVDAGPLIALFRKRDKHRARVKGFLAATDAKLVSTLPVLTKVCHFLNARGKLALLTWVRRGGMNLYPLAGEDLADIERIIGKYADRNIDLADATLVWLAGLINTTEIMTIDRAAAPVSVAGCAGGQRHTAAGRWWLRSRGGRS